MSSRARRPHPISMIPPTLAVSVRFELYRCFGVGFPGRVTAPDSTLSEKTQLGTMSIPNWLNSCGIMSRVARRRC